MKQASEKSNEVMDKESLDLIEAQIQIVRKLRLDLIEKGSLELTMKDHYRIVDHLAATLCSFKLFLSLKN